MPPMSADPLPGPSPYQRTIQSVRTALETTFAEVDTWFDKPPSIRAVRPSTGGWTIDEVLEHITLTSHFLMIVIRNSTRKARRRAAAGAVVAVGESNLELLEPIARRGSFSWPRPEHMVPTGKPASTEVRQWMREQLQECLDLLAGLSHGEGSLFHVRMSVHDSGKLDVYQWLYFLAQHARRHIAQMEENEREARSERGLLSAVREGLADVEAGLGEEFGSLESQ
jgi:hypothetical protein